MEPLTRTDSVSLEFRNSGFMELCVIHELFVNDQRPTGAGRKGKVVLEFVIGSPLSVVAEENERKMFINVSGMIYCPWYDPRHLSYYSSFLYTKDRKDLDPGNQTRSVCN